MTTRHPDCASGSTSRPPLATDEPTTGNSELIQCVRRVSPIGGLREGVRSSCHPRARWLGVGVIAGGFTGAMPFADAAPFPAVLPLESLLPGSGGDGSLGFVLTGVDQYDYSGYSVSASGDVNGDGIADLVVGAPRAQPDGFNETGAGYVVFGSTAGFSAVFPLRSLLPGGGGDGTRGFMLSGIEPVDRAATSVSDAGDVNGDGIDDLIVSAPAAEPGGNSNTGESYVVFGSARRFPSVFPLEALHPAGGGDGTRGFVLTGIDENDHSGDSVSAAGDVNGDGIDDLVVGADEANVADRFDAGESYVVFGSATGFAAVFPLATLYPAGGGDGTRGFVLAGIDVDDHSGASVSTAGDVNSDGIDDLIVGAPCASHGGGEDGESYVVFGSLQGFPAVLPLASLFPAGGGDGTRGFVLTGIRPDDCAGGSVSAAGDVNGDGVGDVMIGATGADPGGRSDAGESYVVFGSAEGFPAVLPLASFLPVGGGDGTRGFVLTGVDDGDRSGYALSAAGDLNGDGVDDLIIGARWSDECYIVFGSERYRAVFPLTALYPWGGGDGTRGVVIAGNELPGDPGRAVAAAGDVNGDGIDDVIIGAPETITGAGFYAGASYVVFGRGAAAR